MTKIQRKNWEARAISHEKTILDYFARNPDKQPDGSFIMSMVIWAYAAGKRDGRRRTKGEPK